MFSLHTITVLLEPNLELHGGMRALIDHELGLGLSPKSWTRQTVQLRQTKGLEKTTLPGIFPLGLNPEQNWCCQALAGLLSEQYHHTRGWRLLTRVLWTVLH